MQGAVLLHDFFLLQDELMFKKFVREGYEIARPNSQGLVHMYHSRFKDWSKTDDVCFYCNLACSLFFLH